MSRRCPVLDLVAELATWLEIADDDHPEDATDLDLVRFAVDQVGDDPETVERVQRVVLDFARDELWACYQLTVSERDEARVQLDRADRLARIFAESTARDFATLDARTAELEAVVARCRPIIEHMRDEDHPVAIHVSRTAHALKLLDRLPKTRLCAEVEVAS